MTNAGPRGGLEGGAMLRDPATDRIRTDEEHAGPTGKRVGQRSRVIKIAMADLGAASTQFVQCLGPTTDQDDVRRR